MEFEIGEYVRSKNGIIAKVENGAIIDNTEIVKRSKDIFDLIEVEDYVNGEKVICFRNDDCDYDVGTEYNDDYGFYFGFNKKDIESIVTKEQFAKIEYKIKKWENNLLKTTNTSIEVLVDDRKRDYKKMAARTK